MRTVRLSVPASGPAAGYPGHHASNPNLLRQLMEAAMNCVRDYVQVRRAERVLVVAEFDTDPLVAGSLASAATLWGQTSPRSRCRRSAREASIPIRRAKC